MKKDLAENKFLDDGKDYDAEDDGIAEDYDIEVPQFKIDQDKIYNNSFELELVKINN